MRKLSWILIILGSVAFLVFAFISPVLFAWMLGGPVPSQFDPNEKNDQGTWREHVVEPNWAMRLLPRLYDPMLVGFAEWSGWRVGYRGHSYGGAPFLIFVKGSPPGESPSKIVP